MSVSHTVVAAVTYNSNSFSTSQDSIWYAHVLDPRAVPALSKPLAGMIHCGKGSSTDVAKA